MSDISVKEAIQKVTSELNSSEGYRIAWQANIAVQFQDEWQRAVDEGGLPCTREQIHAISNKAAGNFINLLCMETKRDDHDQA